MLVYQRSYSNYIILEALIGCSALCCNGNFYEFDFRVRQEKRLKDGIALQSWQCQLKRSVFNVLRNMYNVYWLWSGRCEINLTYMALVVFWFSRKILWITYTNSPFSKSYSSSKYHNMYIVQQKIVVNRKCWNTELKIIL